MTHHPTLGQLLSTLIDMGLLAILVWQIVVFFYSP